MENRPLSQALFRAVGRDGTEWLFVAGCDGGWAILRNGNEVGLGNRRQASIDAGVQKFLSLTRVSEGSNAGRNPVVAARIDRIEWERSAIARVADYQGRTRPDASKESPVYWTT